MLPLPYNLARRARGVTDGDRSIAQRLAVPVSIAVAVFTFVLLQVLHRLIPATGADFRAMLKGAQDITLGQDLYGPAIQFLGIWTSAHHPADACDPLCVPAAAGNPASAL